MWLAHLSNNVFSSWTGLIIIVDHHISYASTAFFQYLNTLSSPRLLNSLCSPSYRLSCRMPFIWIKNLLLLFCLPLSHILCYCPPSMSYNILLFAFQKIFHIHKIKLFTQETTDKQFRKVTIILKLYACILGQMLPFPKIHIALYPQKPTNLP